MKAIDLEVLEQLAAAVARYLHQINRQGPDNVRVVVLTAANAVLADVERRAFEASQLVGEDILAGVSVSG